MRWLILTLLAAMLMVPAPAQAQELPPQAAPNNVVVAVFFFLETCPHCHTVMDEVLPPLQAQYGDQLHILFMDAALGDNGRAMFLTCGEVGVPSDYCGSVPLMVVGDEWMLGAADIPARMPGLIEDGLANGGVAPPDVPEVRSAYTQVFGDTGSNGSGGSGGSAAAATETSNSVLDRLAADPEGNAIAVVVLLLLVASLGAVAFAWQNPGFNLALWGPRAAAGAAGAGALIAFSLAIGEGSDALPMFLAIGATALLSIAALQVLVPDRREFAVPLIAFAGLLVAGYLTHIETTNTAAVCGLVGDCSAVQSSAYAKLFGVLPVGLLGIVGYVLMLGVWSLGYFEQKQRTFANAALFVMALFGVAFSIYLTFLEPFVIGATCAWCITSALTMLAILWLVAEPGFKALRDLTSGSKPLRQA